MSTTLVIARLTFHEAARRKILLAALLMGFLFQVVYLVGLIHINGEIQRDNIAPIFRREFANTLVMVGLYVVNFLTMMMTVLTSVDTLAGEISSGTIHALLAKPVRRWEIVLGKWMGFTIMMTCYLILMAGGVLLTVYLVTGYAPRNFVLGVALMWLNGALLLNVSLLGGAFLSTLANGVLVFGLFGVAFVGGWIEHVGSFLQSQSAIAVGIICSLIFPSESLWRRAAHEMQSQLLASFGLSPFAAPSAPNSVMLGYAVLYALIALVWAARRFSARDL